MDYMTLKEASEKPQGRSIICVPVGVSPVL